MERMTLGTSLHRKLYRMSRSVRTMGDVCSTIKGRRAALLTFTYAPGQKWQPSDIRNALHRARMWIKRRGFRVPYVWAMELHKSGVPHYHVVMWLPWGTKLPLFDAQGWWEKGSTNAKFVKDRRGRYLAKYVSKTANGDSYDRSDFRGFPPRCRIHGRGGLSGALLGSVRWFLLPGWVRGVAPEGAALVRCRGGYVDRLTGEFFGTPYLVRYGPGGLELWNTGLPLGGNDKMEIMCKVREVGSEKRQDGRTEFVAMIETRKPISIHRVTLHDGMDPMLVRELVEKECIAAIEVRPYKDRLFLRCSELRPLTGKAGA